MSETGLRRGRLVQGIGSFYTAVDESGARYTLRCKKKFRRRHISPLVGDEVLFLPGQGEEDGWLEAIRPRRSEVVRPPVSNVSLMLVVLAPSPAPDLLLCDRMLAIARMQDIRCAILAAKSDLDADFARELSSQYHDVPVLRVCALNGEGFAETRELMRGELCCLTGQSGVGKSTLLGALLGLDLETGEISQKIERGKNTTRRADLLMKDGLCVLDTAGFSLLEFQGTMDPVTLREFYPEFHPLEGKCRFSPCLHDREPGCAVSAACERGEIDPRRLQRYRQLLQEVRQTWRDRYD